MLLLGEKKEVLHALLYILCWTVMSYDECVSMASKIIVLTLVRWL